MIPGSILHDKKFSFKDGQIGNKLLIVLNDGLNYPYIVVKTTSKQKTKGRDEGCQLNDVPPNFFFSKGTCCFDLDTWAELIEFYEFDVNEIFAKRLNKTLELKDNLPKNILTDLLNCAKNCDDITIKQSEIITEILKKL
jgi:hypothetical protein